MRDRRAPAAGLPARQMEFVYDRIPFQQRMHRATQVANAFSVDDAHAQNAAPPTFSEILGHHVFHLLRTERVQIKHAVNRQRHGLVFGVHGDTIARTGVKSEGCAVQVQTSSSQSATSFHLRNPFRRRIQLDFPATFDSLVSTGFLLNMTNAYHQLLDAAIRDLEDQKSRGVRHVSVTVAALEALARPISNRGATATDAPAHVASERLASSAAKPVRPAPSPAIRKPVFPRSAAKLEPVPLIEDPAPAPVLPALDPAAKAAAFAELRTKVLACVKCPHLVASRKTVVFGVGNPDAALMFVGEAPGSDEDEQGEPFVGAAGQLLTKIIQATGLAREQVYIANILKCRPDTPGQSSGNRKPTSAEMQTCIPWLHQQIDLIRPRVLVALGATAVEGLLGKTTGISKLRGTWRTYRSIPLMPTYHPAYLLRNQAMSEKRKVWEDMLAVMEKLQMPISEKQQNFFLRTAA